MYGPHFTCNYFSQIYGLISILRCLLFGFSFLPATNELLTAQQQTAGGEEKKKKCTQETMRTLTLISVPSAKTVRHCE